ncbi:hypothetical protein ACH5RR_026801 [Cinchona calisaya]|uniref:Uncharacterized protein n=1 Tax=Cinchona calisaya TaxID=153742 RepID=A0ABD2Z4R8_9GENT
MLEAHQDQIFFPFCRWLLSCLSMDLIRILFGGISSWCTWFWHVGSSSRSDFFPFYRWLLSCLSMDLIRIILIGTCVKTEALVIGLLSFILVVAEVKCDFNRFATHELFSCG